MDALFFTILLLTIVFAVGVRRAWWKSNRIESLLQNYSGFSPDHWLSGSDEREAIAIDTTAKKVSLVVLNREMQERIVSYRDLLSVEILEDGHPISATRRKGIGVAAVYADTARELAIEVNAKPQPAAKGRSPRIQLRVQVSDAASPVHCVSLLQTSGTEADSGSMRAALEVARMWEVRIGTLIMEADLEDAATHAAAH